MMVSMVSKELLIMQEEFWLMVEVYKLKGFKNQSPKIEKVRLTKGNHSVTVEVENFPTREYKNN